MTIRWRILVTTTALVTGVVLTMVGSLSWAVGAQVEKAAVQTSAKASDAINRELADTQAVLLSQSKLLADRPGTKSVFEADSATISDHLDELVGVVNADWLVMADADGKVIGGSERSRIAIGLSVANLFGPTQELSSKPFSGLIVRGNKGVIVAASPILIGEYTQAFVLVARDVDRELLAQISSSSGAEIAVVSKSRVVSSTLPSITGASFDRVEQHFSEGGKQYISNVVPLSTGTGGLVFLTLLDRASIVAPFQPIRQCLFLLMAMGLIAAVASGLWLALTLTRPLNEVINAAKRMDDCHVYTPFESRRSDEIGRLQTVFDKIAQSAMASREQMAERLSIDPLTGLTNYRTFRQNLEAKLSKHMHDGESLSLIMFDLDQFDNYNQVNGHEAGDDALKRVAEIIALQIGRNDLSSRYSGNVFGVVICGQDAIQMAANIRDRIQEEVGVTASAGICEANLTTQRADVMLLAAELATAQAKSAGRNRIRSFDGFEFNGTTDEFKRYLQQGSYSAIRALAEAVDAKDEYTRGHSERVAQYARELATACDYDPGFVELVFITGTLHDVGKIGVPDVILKKSSKLTPEEFEMVKLHPELGEKIVSQIPQLKDTLAGIRHHHERWDGHGYPDGIAGEAIPLVARILAIADTFDAMASNRPYRNGMPLEAALAEIERSGGTQFDPELVPIFLEVWNEKIQPSQAA